jgi:hypothetical protein
MSWKPKWVVDPQDKTTSHGVRLVNYDPDEVGRMVEIKPAERDALQEVLEELWLLIRDQDSAHVTKLNILSRIAGEILTRYQASEPPAEWKPK